MGLAGLALLAAGVSARASSVEDTRIETTAKGSYVFKTYLKDDSIDVSSKNGFVTLTGTVFDLSHKSLAEETVAGEAGVKSVSNNLSITGGHSEENGDTWIGVKVRTTLLSHRSVNGFGTRVDVKGGVVTLQGEASSAAQKELTTEYAQNVEGVDRVINKMSVMSSGTPTLGERIDDASITAQVKIVLLYHRSTSALKTGVQTRDGLVVLSGKAQNAAEIELVTRLAEDIHGVRDVQNHMTIAARGERS
jgi:hyperosmotically inducible periplasmic protein